MKFLLLLLAFLPLSTFAQVTSVDLKKVGGAIDVVTLKGSFSAKEAPLLYDQANEGYEKGILNRTFATIAETRELTLGDTRYNAKAIWQTANAGIFIQNNKAFARTETSGAYYFGSNANAFIGDPRVHSRSGTPVESKKLYLSWWFKPQNDTRDYIPVKVTNVSTDFKPVEGDEFSVAVDKDWTGVTQVYGRVINYDPAKSELVGNFYGQANPNKIIGKTVTLNSNGAKASIVEATGWRGANKYVRIWESDGSEGSFRMSWTNTTVAVDSLVTYKVSNVIAREWNHMELFIDQTAKKVWTKVNGLADQSGTYEGVADVPGYSPTIGLIGFDASVDLIQKFWMDDIYMDKSFRRITLGDADKYTAVTSEEVQYYTSWTDSEITFKPNYGSLNRSKPAYIYIYDENGVPNPAGIKLESPILMLK
ncbi:hypothetical protein [Cellvibrio mixtus]|uniref:hypothetical protein n=1 Tax=Cellvibrio mixtus TaxID=39650 RepID=UPI00058733F8|nr:hypothetical protein [Cellvibrio mixtus]